MIHKKEYKDFVDRQHAPEELIRRTLQKITEKQDGQISKYESQTIRAEERASEKVAARKHGIPGKIWVSVAAAAAALFIAVRMFPAGSPHQQTSQIFYAKVTQRTVIGTGNMTLGKAESEAEASQKQLPEGLEYQLLEKESHLPQGILEASPCSIKGVDVYFGEDGSDLFAAFRQGEGWSLYSSRDIGKDEFEKMIQKEVK